MGKSGVSAPDLPRGVHASVGPPSREEVELLPVNLEDALERALNLSRERQRRQETVHPRKSLGIARWICTSFGEV